MEPNMITIEESWQYQSVYAFYQECVKASIAPGDAIPTIVSLDPISSLEVLSPGMDNRLLYQNLDESEYFTIPEYNRYAINCSGEVHNKSTSGPIEHIMTQHGPAVLISPDKSNRVRLCLIAYLMVLTLGERDETPIRQIHFHDTNRDNVQLNNLDSGVEP